MSVEQRLKELGITLPPAGGPLGNYVPARRVGPRVFKLRRRDRRGAGSRS